IDIIEPLEILGSNIKNQLEKISLFIMKLPIKKTIVKNIFSEIKTGKLNANAATKEGFYPFFTCSSKIQKTNFNSFKGRYIILSGNGEIYTWWMDGEFDLYQRVYALKEKENFFSTYFSVKKGIENLRRRSNGAVIKFIKKSDIESIEKYESNYEQILKYLFIVENKLQKKLSKLNKIKGHLIKLLIK
ncbi:MAG: hypothetical protein GY679_03995, partial [Mycoplasma sp.]|nr:hypothetical protein [Mycoplasma sp.]